MKIFAFTLWALCLAIFVVLAVLPDVIVIENNSDKMLHVTGLCVLMLWPTITFAKKRYIFICALLLILAGVVVELAQTFVPLRTASIEDALANVLGVSAGLVIGFLIRSDTRRN